MSYYLILVTDRTQLNGKSLVNVIKSSGKAGVNAVVLREKDLDAKDLFELAFSIKKVCLKQKLLINGRCDIAKASNADGVHLTELSIPIKKAREILGKNKLIGKSCHSLKSALKALKDGADYIFIGPVFFTESKRKYGDPLGLSVIKKIREKTKKTIIAIGGIKAENVPLVLQNGASGVAVISGIFGAKDTTKAVKHYRLALDNFKR